jgi:hypothetical protein
VIGAGTIINPIIKVVTTVAILGAVYLFIVKPALDTTEDITDRAFESSSSLQESIQNDIQESLDAADLSGNIPLPDSARKAQRLGDCVTAADGDLDRIERCMARFSP